MTPWLSKATIPRDGRPVIVAIRGADFKGWPWHELPYRLRFLNGRWCYERNGAPIFWWHEPMRWREEVMEMAA